MAIVLVHLILLSSQYSEYFSQNSIWSSEQLVELGSWRSGLSFLWENMWILFSVGFCLGSLAFLTGATWTLLPLGLVLIFIQQRNFWISDAGDKLLILLLFWVWILSEAKSKWVKFFFSLQLCVIYLQNGYFKLHPAWLHERNALDLIWSDPGLTYTWFRELTWKPFSSLSFLIPFIELILPVFLFTRFKKKVAWVFIAYHVFIFFTMNLGVFSGVMLSWWAVFLNQTESEREHRTDLRFVLSALWIVVILFQTIMLPFKFTFPASVENFLSESYLKQKWSMFGQPWIQRSGLSFQCYKSDVAIPCPSIFEDWSSRGRWDHRQLTLVDKMVLRSNTLKLKQDFHRYLCSRISEVEEIQIRFERMNQEEIVGVDEIRGSCGPRSTNLN